jgi:hypothetical protein
MLEIGKEHEFTEHKNNNSNVNCLHKKRGEIDETHSQREKKTKNFLETSRKEYSYLIMKSAAKARSPGTSHMAIAISIFVLIGPAAEGFRPIAPMAPIPISPIPTPEPITPISARGRNDASIVEKFNDKPCSKSGTKSQSSSFLASC